MPNLFNTTKGFKWLPDADPTNAPEGTLLLADNLVPDPEGLLSLRGGSRRIFNGMQTLVHSAYTRVLGNQTFRFNGSDNRLYRNGVDFGQTFDGVGDIPMGDDAYQAFFARGTTKKKFDGTNFYNWGIPAPELKATLAALTALTLPIASFDSTESPAFVVNEGTGAFVAGFDLTANGALKLTPAATARATASKIFASDQDMLNILGAVGSDTDLFDIYTWMEEPTKVDKLTMMFGLGTGADPFRDDYYYFDFSIRDPSTVDLKDATSVGASSFSSIADRVQSVLTPNDITDVKTPDDVVAVLKRLGRFAGPRSRERKDPQQNSPAWTHLSVTRGQFNRVGGTAGRNWQTVRGFKVVYTATAGATTVVQFDSAVMTGGGDRALTGKYRLGYRFVRNFNDVYYELSPISPISSTIELTQQALQATIPAAALAGKDPQVNQIWVYLIGGFLDTYYRFAVLGATIRQGMTIDELTNPAGSDYNTPGERTRLSAWGFTEIAGAVVAADLVFTIRKSELDALIENEKLEPGVVGPPDQIIAVVGPFNNRMFLLTAEGRLYPSSQDNPSSYSLYHHLDLRRYGTPLWCILTGGGVYVGMTKDVIRIGGTGDESDDHVSVDLFPEPLHVGNPPVDSCVVSDGNSIIYRSIDGLILLTGVTVATVPDYGTGLLWRNQSRHGVPALNTSFGRFRMAIDNHILYMLAPEGSSYSTPTSAEETASWPTLTGLSLSAGVLTKTAATGFNNVQADSNRILLSGDGYIATRITSTTTQQLLGLSTTQSSDGDYTKMNFALNFNAAGQVDIYEVGTLISAAVTPYSIGDVFKIEIISSIVYYKKNDLVIYTSTRGPVYPIAPDVAFNETGSSLGPITLFGNWTLIDNSSHVIWRLSIDKKVWSRCVYPMSILSMFRDPSGALIVGSNTGELWEIETGTQDNAGVLTSPVDIAVTILSYINDGGAPLNRKDFLDFQIHADTGGNQGNVDFMLDGSSTAIASFPFSCSGAAVHRSNILSVGVGLKIQAKVTGSFNRFLLHSYNLTYRNRVQEVMVLDTGTIAPQGNNILVWMSVVDIDCISPVDLALDVYIDDLLKTTQTVIITTPNRRSSFRVQLPRGCKGRAPRLVFRTTNPAGSSNPGFEPYRVRVRDRQTGTQTENEFRVVWPLAIALPGSAP